MYEKYFGLVRSPFDLAPNPACLFLSGGHKEALGKLVYGIENRKGFVVFTGEVGTGKTTLLRSLFRSLEHDKWKVVYVIDPTRSFRDLLLYLLEEYEITGAFESESKAIEALSRRLISLYESGVRNLLLIDEAQLMSPEVLERIRLLTNLETDRDKLLQIVLVGQPELDDTLDLDQLRQLKQRIALRVAIGPLSEKEVGEYIDYRLASAGSELLSGDVFEPAAVDELVRYTQGYPRLINVLCDNVFLNAFVEQRRLMTRQDVAVGAESLRMRARKGIARTMWYRDWGGKGARANSGLGLNTVAWVVAGLLFAGVLGLIVTTRLAEVQTQSASPGVAGLTGSVTKELESVAIQEGGSSSSRTLDPTLGEHVVLTSYSSSTGEPGIDVRSKLSPVDQILGRQAKTSGARDQASPELLATTQKPARSDAAPGESSDSRVRPSAVLKVSGPSLAERRSPNRSSRRYRVLPGDSLWKIASREYGNASVNTLEAIQKLNAQISDFDRLRVGQLLMLPVDDVSRENQRTGS